MEGERRPRASAWRIAGVWIAAAALLLTAARMGLDLWQIFGEYYGDPHLRPHCG